MMKIKLLLLTMIILVASMSLVQANWTYGDFNAGGNDGWFIDWLTNATVAPLSTTVYSGSSCLMWVITMSGSTTWNSADVTVAPAGASGWDFTGETTMEVRIAITGNIPSANLGFFTKSNPWTLPPATWHLQPTDGAFSTYTFPIDSTFVVYPTLVSYPMIVSVGNTGLAVVTCYLDYAKSFGSLLQAPANVYSDWHYDHELNWIVNWNPAAVQNHVGGQNTTGLYVDKSGIGTLSWVDLSTTHSGGNIGGAVSGPWGSLSSWAAYPFIEMRVSVATTGTVGTEAYVNGQLFVQGPWKNKQISLPIDGQYHTYSISYEELTTSGSYTRNYNQIGINLYGHGNSDLLVTIDNVMFKYSGTPIIYVDGVEAGVYTNPANTIYVMPNTPLELTAYHGLAPFTWSLTSVAGNPGTLNTTSGATVSYQGTGGSCYITLTDGEGRTIRTANIVVTPTSAPLATDWDLMDIR